MEQWKQHNLIGYMVSNLGRIKSNTKFGEKLIDRERYHMYDRCNKKRVCVKRVTLLKEYWCYEFIKYLDDDEECKEIKNKKGYFITTKGRVWSSRGQCFMKITDSPVHYYHSIGITGTTYMIHQLVGRTFLEDYREGLCILHRDESLPYPEIDFVENLWVGSQNDNMKDCRKKNRLYIKLTPIDIHMIKLISPSYTQKQLGKMYGVHRSTIIKYITS